MTPTRDARERLAEFLKDRDEALFAVPPEANDAERLISADCILALLSPEVGRLGSSRDHALTVGDGQGNPTLAASDASVSVPRVLLERVLADYIQMSGQPRVDPLYGREVERLGSRIGFGAMMVSASASWANLIPGGEFCVGPCRATAKATCDQIAALFVTHTPTGEGAA